MPLDNTDLYHIAWVVDDLELSMKAFGLTGLQWATPAVRTVKVQTPTTAITEFSIFVTYSKVCWFAVGSCTQRWPTSPRMVVTRFQKVNFRSR